MSDTPQALETLVILSGNQTDDDASQCLPTVVELVDASSNTKDAED